MRKALKRKCKYHMLETSLNLFQRRDVNNEVSFRSHPVLQKELQMDYGRMPIASGPLAIGVGVGQVSGNWLVAGAVAVVLIAAIAIRFGFRRGRQAVEQ
jgi:hypothetical protein